MYGERSPGLELLELARELIERGWCQGADARDSAGADVDPWEPLATSWSLLGAIVAALEEVSGAFGELPLAHLAAALYALAEIVDDDSLTEWNDDPRRTRDEVLRALLLAREFYEDPWPNEVLLHPN